MSDLNRDAVEVAHLREQNAKLRDVNRQLGHAENEITRLKRDNRVLTDERDAARAQVDQIRRPAPVRGLLARLVDREVRRLDGELAHVRHTRRLIARTASDRNTECLALRARVAELEQLLLNPNTLKGIPE